MARCTLVLLALVLGIAAPGHAQMDPPKDCFTLVDSIGIEPEVSMAARNEARRVLESLGVRTVWCQARSLLLLPDSETPVILVPYRSAEKSGVMGVTLLTGRLCIWIHPDIVATGLGLLPDRVWSPDERDSYARALGRVIAHEMVHVVLRVDSHADSGLMSASLDRWELTAPQIRVDPWTRVALRAAVDAKNNGATAAAPLTCSAEDSPAAESDRQR